MAKCHVWPSDRFSKGNTRFSHLATVHLNVDLALGDAGLPVEADTIDDRFHPRQRLETLDVKDIANHRLQSCLLQVLSVPSVARRGEDVMTALFPQRGNAPAQVTAADDQFVHGSLPSGQPVWPNLP